MKYTFSLIGLIIFILPMIINIVYVIFPPVNAEDINEHNNKFLELIEQISRILFAIALCTLPSPNNLNYKSCSLYISILFLVLYHIVWIRYFINGRDVKMLGEKFLSVPMPLAVFPVLYYLFASLWIQNYTAALIMIIFGLAHNIVSYKSLYCKKTAK